jgi:hypothetical protein
MSILKMTLIALMFTTATYGSPNTDPVQDEITMGKIAAAEQALLNEKVIIESQQLIKEALEMRQMQAATSASSNWKISALNQMIALIINGLDQMETPEDVAAVQALNEALKHLMQL